MGRGTETSSPLPGEGASPQTAEAASRTASLGTLAALIGMVSVQIGAAFAKTLFPVVGPEGMAALRLAMSAAVLAIVFRPWRVWRQPGIWPALLAYGVTLGIMNLTIYHAFSLIPVSIAVSIEVIGPLSVALLLSRRRIDLLWIGLSVIGLCLLPFNALGSSLNPLGIAFALAAALLWALYMTFGARVAHLGPKAVSTGMLIAATFVVPIGVAHAGATLWQGSMLAIGFAVALLSSMIPYLLDMYALHRIPSRVFGVLMSASPAMAALASWLILGETLSVYQGIGIAAITIACAGSARYSRQRT